MKNDDRIQKIINQFIEAAKKHHSSIMSGDSRKANVHAKKIRKIFLEIREIGNEAREALLRETNNEDNAVATLAATYSLKYNTEKSLNVLYRISQVDSGILGFRAKQAILRWEEGEWQLE